MLRDLNDPMISTYEVMTGMPGTLATPVRIDLIDSIGRLREVDLQKVAALKASIEEIGLHSPIYVTGPRAATDEVQPRVRLVAGAHRLEAMRQLGREWIGAYYYEGDDLDAELWEIDENLCRAELTPADRALCVFRRKEIYLMKHPETAHGAVGNGREKSRQVGDSTGEETKRFTTATAEATGQSERAVQRDAERGEKISDKALRMLRGTHHDKGTTLDRLKSLRVDEQEVYVKALFDSDKEKTREAKALRDSKQKLSRSVRFEIIKAIADKGAVRTGEMPVAAFPVVYADPPWEQESYSEETGQDKGLRYPAMPLDDIKALCAGERSPATRDAILLLWTTASRLKDGLDVMAAWGFAYKSHLVWDKVNIGMGRWVRDRHELLLIGTRGDFPGLIPGTQPHSVYSEVKGSHSVKPTWFAGEIDRLFPDLPKLELFQRKESLHFADVRNGPTWSFWGFEASEPEADECVEPATDPIADKLISAGLVPNTYILELNRGLTNPLEVDLPSRLFRFPVEYMSRERCKASSGRLLLRHPLLRDAPQVAPFLDGIEEKVGIRPEWQEADEFGRDMGWGWYHAVDLCTDKHWQDLLETRMFTEPESIFGAVKLAMEGKSLSVKHARAVMLALGSTEPDDRSAAQLIGKGLWPFRDGDKKFIAPNISLKGEAAAWLAIHGLEDKWLTYVGGHLSVTVAGMDRRTQAAETCEAAE